MKYKIIQESAVHLLVWAVEREIEEGWKPIGGMISPISEEAISYGMDSYKQTMIKDDT